MENDKKTPKLNSSFFGFGKKINSNLTNLGRFPYSPPLTPSTTSFSHDTSQGSFASSKVSDSKLVRDLKELGIDVNESNWKVKLEEIIEGQSHFLSLVNEKVWLLSKNDELIKKNFQLKNKLVREKERVDTAISDREKRANITQEDLKKLQEEKDNSERELGILENTLKELLGIADTDPLSHNWIDTVNSWKNDVALTNYNNEVVVHNSTKSQLKTAKTSLLTEQSNHLATCERLTTTQNTIANFQEKLGIINLNNLPLLPNVTTNLENLITEFNNLTHQVVNLTKNYAAEKKRVNDYEDGLQEIFGLVINDNLSVKTYVGSIRAVFDEKEKIINTLSEYQNALTDQIKIDVSIPSWKNDLAAKLGGKNFSEITVGKTLKDLIDGNSVNDNTITDLQSKLDQEKKQLQQQKIVSQQLGSEKLHLQQEISNCEVNLLKYFIEKLNLELEDITKEQTLAGIWELINGKPSEELVQELRQKIHEQEEIITNYQKEKDYVGIITIQEEATQFLKNCGISSTNNYQTQIRQSASYKKISSLQQQAISEEMSKIKSSEKSAKTLNLFLFISLSLSLDLFNNFKKKRTKKYRLQQEK